MQNTCFSSQDSLLLLLLLLFVALKPCCAFYRCLGTLFVLFLCSWQSFANRWMGRSPFRRHQLFKRTRSMSETAGTFGEDTPELEAGRSSPGWHGVAVAPNCGEWYVCHACLQHFLIMTKGYEENWCKLATRCLEARHELVLRYWVITANVGWTSVGWRQKPGYCKKHACRSFYGHNGFRPGSSVASPVYTKCTDRRKDYSYILYRRVIRHC